MTIPAVAKKDFQDGIRSKLLWVLIAFFVVSLAGFAYLATSGSGSTGDDAGLVALLGFAAVAAVIVIVPLTGLTVSIKSIVRERELGTIRILLSLPHSRRDAVLGKFIGRSGLLTTAILAGFVPMGLILAVRTSNFPVTEYLMFVLVTVLFGVVFVAIGIGVSAFTATETRATIAGVLFFFLMYTWTSIVGWINNQMGSPLGPDAFDFLRRFQLFNVFIDTLLVLLSLTSDLSPTDPSWVRLSRSLAELQSGPVESVPFYFQLWFAPVVLAIWIVVPLTIGYYRFEHTDL